MRLLVEKSRIPAQASWLRAKLCHSLAYQKSKAQLLKPFSAITSEQVILAFELHFKEMGLT